MRRLDQDLSLQLEADDFPLSERHKSNMVWEDGRPGKNKLEKEISN